MRDRIRKERKNDAIWDIKQRVGGLIDAEFISQYLSLRFPVRMWGDSKPAALSSRFKTNSAIDERDIAILETGTIFWSRLQFMLRLTTDDSVKIDNIPVGLKSKLAETVGAENFSALEELMTKTADSVSTLFSQHIGAPAANFKESKKANS